MIEDRRKQYYELGYVVLRGVVDPVELTGLADVVEALARKGYSRDARRYRDDDDIFSEQFADWLENTESSMSQWLYETVRDSAALSDFACVSDLIKHVGAIVGYREVKPKAARFRMDQPRDLRYLAVWHQDHAYVGGSVDTVTAWVPLQDVDWTMGPLLVAPKSHLFGPRPHTRIVGNRKCPEELNLSDLHAVQLRRGDVLLFHSLLLHSGQPNLSDRVRYSVQVRYEPL